MFYPSLSRVHTLLAIQKKKTMLFEFIFLYAKNNFLFRYLQKKKQSQNLIVIVVVVVQMLCEL